MRWLVPLAAAVLLAGCGGSEAQPTPTTIVVVGDATLRAAEAGIRPEVGDTFARFTKGARKVARPVTTCVGLVGTDREFSCGTTVEVRTGRGDRCSVTVIKQAWRGRVATPASPTWTRDGAPRRVSRAECA
jgi:hypothetical protein